jgi:hypothetical protein
MTIKFLLPRRGFSVIRLIGLLAGALFLATAPIQAKAHGKMEQRYSAFYKHIAYTKGFDDGYDGKDHNNTFTVETDRLLYKIGFLAGDEAYLEEKNRRETRLRFF